MKTINGDNKAGFCFVRVPLARDKIIGPTMPLALFCWDH